MIVFRPGGAQGAVMLGRISVAQWRKLAAD